MLHTPVQGLRSYFDIEKRQGQVEKKMGKITTKTNDMLDTRRSTVRGFVFVSDCVQSLQNNVVLYMGPSSSSGDKEMDVKRVAAIAAAYTRVCLLRTNLLSC